MNKALIVPHKKKILLNDSHPTRITTSIPTSKIIVYKGKELVVVPHELDEVRVLNNMGYEIDSPVRHYYPWSGQYTPFHAQLVTTDKMTLNERMFVLNGMGLGKSVSALWAFDYLRSIRLVKRMLIITPLSTTDLVWGNEIFRHFPHLEASVLYGSAKRRVAQLEYPADIYIINHDGIKIPEIREALISRKDIDVVTIDEIAEFRNAATDRWKALKKIAAGRKYLWGMTGTPIPNRPTDAWAQCRLIAPHRVPPYFGAFREMVERKVSTFKWVARDNALQTVQEAMQPSVLFQLSDMPEAELPPTMYSSRYVEMSSEQKKAYKQMMTSLVAEAANGTIVAVNEAVKTGRLAQIACIAYSTPVLCFRGWIPIQSVTESDLVWDGVEWVSQGGAVCKGDKRVVNCGGVWMTPDHKVLSTDGWITAEEMRNGWKSGNRYEWASVREPDRGSEMRHEQAPGSSVEMSMLMRRGCNSKGETLIQRRDYPLRSSTTRADGHQEAVYDLINCGPRDRFVVKGSEGELRIVHNCGVSYDQQGNCVRFKCDERLAVLKEIITESAGKVIVFIPLIGGLEMVAEYLRKTWETAVVYGDVGKAERDQIFNDFGRPGGLHVIVAHPRCMAHGLSLVTANTTVWFTPSNNHGDYVQANARTVRPGQKRSTFIVHIEGSEVEKKMYKRLQSKSSMQNLLLDMIKEGLE